MRECGLDLLTIAVAIVTGRCDEKSNNPTLLCDIRRTYVTLSESEGLARMQSSSSFVNYSTCASLHFMHKDLPRLV